MFYPCQLLINPDISLNAILVFLKHNRGNWGKMDKPALRLYGYLLHIILVWIKYMYTTKLHPEMWNLIQIICFALGDLFRVATSALFTTSQSGKISFLLGRQKNTYTLPLQHARLSSPAAECPSHVVTTCMTHTDPLSYANIILFTISIHI